MPYSINNLNDVLILNGYNTNILWNISTETINYVKNFKGINDNGVVFYSEVGVDTYTMDYNNHGNSLLYREGKFLFSQNGKYTRVNFPGQTYANPILNDQDEIVIVTIIDKKWFLAKWKNDKNVSLIPLVNINELQSFNIFSVNGFNNKGQILLQASDGKESQCFLLAPS